MDITRTTWLLDGKYLMTATAKFLRKDDRRRRDIVETSVMIFDKTWAKSPQLQPLFISISHQHSDSLEVQLEEAERQGRIFTASLDRRATDRTTR